MFINLTHNTSSIAAQHETIKPCTVRKINITRQLQFISHTTLPKALSVLLFSPFTIFFSLLSSTSLRLSVFKISASLIHFTAHSGSHVDRQYHVCACICARLCVYKHRQETCRDLVCLTRSGSPKMDWCQTDGCIARGVFGSREEVRKKEQKEVQETVMDEETQEEEYKGIQRKFTQQRILWFFTSRFR